MPYIKLYEEAGGITYRPIGESAARLEITDYERKVVPFLDVFFISDEEFVLWEGIAISHARLCSRLRALQAQKQETKDIILKRWFK